MRLLTLILTPPPPPPPLPPLPSSPPPLHPSLLSLLPLGRERELDFSLSRGKSKSENLQRLRSPTAIQSVSTQSLAVEDYWKISRFVLSARR